MSCSLDCHAVNNHGSEAVMAVKIHWITINWVKGINALKRQMLPTFLGESVGTAELSMLLHEG